MGNLNLRAAKDDTEESGNKVVAGAKLAVAAHLLAGVAETLESQTDTVISAVLLAIGTALYEFSGVKGAKQSQTWASFSSAFALHALLEASMFENTFVWIATGGFIIVLITTTSAEVTPRSHGRMALEAAATYGLALVAFVDSKNAVLTKALGLILGATSLNLLLSVVFADRSGTRFAFAVAGNQGALGALLVGHAAYYVLREPQEKTLFAQFAALAIAISMSSLGFQS